MKDIIKNNLTQIDKFDKLNQIERQTFYAVLDKFLKKRKEEKRELKVKTFINQLQDSTTSGREGKNDSQITLQRKIKSQQKNSNTIQVGTPRGEEGRRPIKMYEVMTNGNSKFSKRFQSIANQAQNSTD